MKLLHAALAVATLAAQIPDAPPDKVADIPVNYTDANSGSYTIPDPLKLANGKPVRDAKTWLEKRRPEIVKLFEENQFGRTPPAPQKLNFEVTDHGTKTINGKALRKQITVYFGASKTGPKMDLLVYTPANATHPVPLLLNAAFSANSATVDDPGIKPGEIWNREKQRVPATQGRAFGRLKIEPFLDAGFGVATVYYGDIDPDFNGGRPHGVRSLFPEPKSDEWGTVSAWAWGLSRALDYFETDKNIDAKRVAITGVSRLGKTALWTGAHDIRFAMVIASCSGEGGAALSRRNYGETIAHLTAPTRYPYQFAANYGKHAENPNNSPIDAHMLVALIAPRPLLLQTGNTDKWSDPKGEYLAALAAAPVYKLFNKKAPTNPEVPPAGQPMMTTLGYIMHAGGHGTIPSDWDVFLQFMKAHL
ncbi:MAG: alpha/beta hydrolase family protein [Bryobacteraceae bacterium]